MKPAPRERFIALVGAAVGLMMISMKMLPGIPGHFSGWEWLVLGIWSAIGAILGWREISATKAAAARRVV